MGKVIKFKPKDSKELALELIKKGGKHFLEGKAMWQRVTTTKQKKR